MEPASTIPFGDQPPGGNVSALTITEPRWHSFVPHLSRVVARAMGLTGCPAAVILTDDLTIQRLNARDRGKNQPTTVLTYETPPEILLALGTIRREAKAERKSISDHLSHLLVHGSLHLAGYDHDHPGDARRMERAETRLLSVLKIPNPWKAK
jgi:probable rRNA maturation factor